MGYMLETRGLTKRFGRGDQAQDAVADVSLHIREGEVYGLLGPNGAGKSTTLKMTSSSRCPTTDRASLPPPSNAAASASSQTTPPAPRATEAATTGSASTPPPRPRAPTGAPSRSPTAPRAARWPPSRSPCAGPDDSGPAHRRGSQPNASRIIMPVAGIALASRRPCA